MAFKKMTLIDLAFFVVLKDVPFKDDEGLTKILTEVQVDMKLKRATCKFDNGDIQNVGLTDVIEVDPANITYPTTHNGQESTLKPNKKRFKKKKRG